MPVTLTTALAASLRRVLETADVYAEACVALDAAHRARKSPAGHASAEQKRYRDALDVMLNARRAVADGARELAGNTDVRNVLGMPPQPLRAAPNPKRAKKRRAQKWN
ncbi:hypothetical protein [Corallococcus terminator]|uniref:Uncharacterized protein n=1 Tax=Corallococcus terminator TaxID=2316733 RepID=A0A3A8HBJ9_9BACT|nr:hypothetical protein [Corallococcus terminator]RKG68088.1 hypothetical protein D7V88_40845 [Corallococcus terminator]